MSSNKRPRSEEKEEKEGKGEKRARTARFSSYEDFKVQLNALSNSCACLVSFPGQPSEKLMDYAKEYLNTVAIILKAQLTDIDVRFLAVWMWSQMHPVSFAGASITANSAPDAIEAAFQAAHVHESLPDWKSPMFRPLLQELDRVPMPPFNIWSLHTWCVPVLACIHRFQTASAENRRALNGVTTTYLLSLCLGWTDKVLLAADFKPTQVQVSEYLTSVLRNPMETRFVPLQLSDTSTWFNDDCRELYAADQASTESPQALVMCAKVRAILNEPADPWRRFSSMAMFLGVKIGGILFKHGLVATSFLTPGSETIYKLFAVTNTHLAWVHGLNFLFSRPLWVQQLLNVITEFKDAIERASMLAVLLIKPTTRDDTKEVAAVLAEMKESKAASPAADIIIETKKESKSDLSNEMIGFDSQRDAFVRVVTSTGNCVVIQELKIDDWVEDDGEGKCKTTPCWVPTSNIFLEKVRYVATLKPLPRVAAGISFLAPGVVFDVRENKTTNQVKDLLDDVFDASAVWTKEVVQILERLPCISLEKDKKKTRRGQKSSWVAEWKEALRGSIDEQECAGQSQCRGCLKLRKCYTIHPYLALCQGCWSPVKAALQKENVCNVVVWIRTEHGDRALVF